jgi:7-keto-8-aminopelargonate synthetase-like enzyme
VGHAPELVAPARQPGLYEQIEERLTALLGCEDSLVLPTITHIHMSVIPLLAASGTIFLDERAHKTIYDGCQAARARGAAVRRFRFEDAEHLDALMSAERDPTRLVCMDGVNSMTGNPPDLVAFAEVARRHGALLYVDDAHGFGVIGERGPGETSPYGMRGNSIVRYTGTGYDNLVLVAGFSKSYSSLLAFIACSPEIKQMLKVAASPYLYSGRRRSPRSPPCSPGFDVNERRGDALRARLHALTARVLDGAATGSASTRRTAPGCRSSRSRCATTSASTRSGASCSTAASTSRWPPTRSSRRTRSASASSSPRPTPTAEVDRAIRRSRARASAAMLRARDRGTLRGG